MLDKVYLVRMGPVAIVALLALVVTGVLAFMGGWRYYYGRYAIYFICRNDYKLASEAFRKCSPSFNRMTYGFAVAGMVALAALCVSWVRPNSVAALAIVGESNRRFGEVSAAVALFCGVAIPYAMMGICHLGAMLHWSARRESLTANEILRSIELFDVSSKTGSAQLEGVMTGEKYIAKQEALRGENKQIRAEIRRMEKQLYAQRYSSVKQCMAVRRRVLKGPAAMLDLEEQEKYFAGIVDELSAEQGKVAAIRDEIQRLQLRSQENSSLISRYQWRVDAVLKAYGVTMEGRVAVP